MEPGSDALNLHAAMGGGTGYRVHLDAGVNEGGSGAIGDVDPTTEGGDRGSLVYDGAK
jgi:hypothetical protein